GRLPTERGLRFFVDALMQIRDLTERDREAIEGKVAASGKSVENVLNEANGLLSGLTHAAGVVLSAKADVRLKHIEFVRLEPERARGYCVSQNGKPYNCTPNFRLGLPPTALAEAYNFRNAHIRGNTLAEAKSEVEKALEGSRA